MGDTSDVVAMSIYGVTWHRPGCGLTTSNYNSCQLGFRHIHPNMELFSTFAWPSYCILPGLERACLDFLAEPDVLAAEERLRAYWSGYWVGRREQGAVRRGSAEGWSRLVQECVLQVSGPR